MRIAAALGLASLLTLAVAWPVVRSPTQQIFGRAIVGRHPDPFTVMRQMADTGPPAPYIQPLVDWTGWLLARAIDPVAAYNVIVLLAFPLAAAAAYALARYLLASHASSLLAALLFAFTPLHLAHAAYHPHIAQTEWLPLYLLALFAMVDRPSWWRAAGVAGATCGLVLSNFYGGLIGAVVTPVALVGYWWANPRGARRLSSLGLTAATLAALGLAALAAIGLAYPQVLHDTSAYAFPIADVGRYNARWWAYFVPPVSHAALGPMAAGLFLRRGVTLALVEEQIYVGYAVLALAACAGLAATTRAATIRGRRIAIALWAIAITAAVVSVGPLWGGCEPGSWAPACLLHHVAPMFRAYARFAIVVHLALAIAAGIGAAALARRSLAGRMLATCLVLVAIFEYWPLPARARDVLPTHSHRWLASRWPDQKTLDCVAPGPDNLDVPWLMRRQIAFLGGMVPSCRDPHLGSRLAALGYTHVLVREADGDTFPIAEVPSSGVAEIAAYPDSRVYRVTAPAPDIWLVADRGFFAYEHLGAEVWRWMGTEGRWQVRNATREDRLVRLSLAVQSAGVPRRLDVTLDGAPVGSIQAGTMVGSHLLGPWLMAPGDHTLVFTPSGPPFRPAEHGGSTDDRDLTLAFWNWTWMDSTGSTPGDDRAR